MEFIKKEKPETSTEAIEPEDINYYDEIQNDPLVAYACAQRFSQNVGFSPGINCAAVLFLKGEETISCSRKYSRGIGHLGGHAERQALASAFNFAILAGHLHAKEVNELNLKAENKETLSEINKVLKENNIQVKLFTELSPCEQEKGCLEVLNSLLPRGSEILYAVSWQEKQKHQKEFLDALNEIKSEFPRLPALADSMSKECAADFKTFSELEQRSKGLRDEKLAVERRELAERRRKGQPGKK